MSDASDGSFRGGKFSVTNEVVLDLLKKRGGDQGGTIDDLWPLYRAGKELTERQTFKLQQQIVGRLSVLDRLGFLTVTTEPYVTEEGKASLRSRYFIAPVKLEERETRNAALIREVAELKAEVAELQIQKEISHKTIDRLEVKVQELQAIH